MHRTAQKQSRGYEIVSSSLHDASGPASAQTAPILPTHRVPAPSGARPLDVRPRLRSSAHTNHTHREQAPPRQHAATSALSPALHADRAIVAGFGPRGPGDAMEILQGMYTAYRAQGAYSPEQLGRVRC